MAVYNSNAIALGTPIPGEGAGGGQVKTQKCTVALPTGVTTSDTIPLFYLPQNAVVLRGIVKSEALGGGTLNIGDNGFGSVVADPDRYFAALAVTSAAVNTTMAATGVFFKSGLSNNRLLVVAQLATGPTTTAGSLEVAIEYTVEEPQA